MKSSINLEITLDEDKMPESIEWNAPGGGVETMQRAKGVLMGLWDGQEKSAMRIDLWTKNMMVDEMNDFFYQTFLGMADTYTRATKNKELANEMRNFGKTFLEKATDALEKEEKENA